MGRPRKSTPTDGELKVLHVMWALGPATLRDIREKLPEEQRPSPPALATTINAMLEKELIQVVEQRRPQTFEAIMTLDNTRTTFLNDIRKRVFGGSLKELVKHAIGGKKQSAAELAELRSLLKELDDGSK